MEIIGVVLIYEIEMSCKVVSCVCMSLCGKGFKREIRCVRSMYLYCVL